MSTNSQLYSLESSLKLKTIKMNLIIKQYQFLLLLSLNINCILLYSILQYTINIGRAWMLYYHKLSVNHNFSNVR